MDYKIKKEEAIQAILMHVGMSPEFAAKKAAEMAQTMNKKEIIELASFDPDKRIKIPRDSAE